MDFMICFSRNKPASCLNAMTDLWLRACQVSICVTVHRAEECAQQHARRVKETRLPDLPTFAVSALSFSSDHMYYLDGSGWINSDLLT